MVVGCAFWCHEVLCGEDAMKDLFGDVFLMIKDKDASIAWYLGILKSWVCVSFPRFRGRIAWSIF